MDINDLKRLAGVNEATVNISMTGANSAEISDLMNMFKGPEPKPMSIGGPPPPPPGLDIPDIKPPIGLDKPPAPMSLDGPLPPLPPLKSLGMDDGPAPCDSCGGIHGDESCGEDTSWDNEPEPSYQDGEHMTNAISGGVNGRKDPKDIRVKDGASVKEGYKTDLWKALQEKYFTEFDVRKSKVNEYPNEEQTFSGRSDRTYFIVPNEDDYMDIQDDSRFAGDIEVPDENDDLMALPNSKARKLKMMYGNKVLFFGTDYDEAKEKMDRKARRRHLAGISRTKAGGSAGRRSESMQAAREKELKGKQHKLPSHLKKKIEDEPEDQVNSGQYDEEMDDIRRLSGLTTEDELGAAMNKADDPKVLAAEIFPGKPPEKVVAFLAKKMGGLEQAKQYLLARKAKQQQSQVQQSKPKPMPASTDTYKGSGIKSKPLKYNKQSGAPKTPTVNAGNVKNWMQKHKQ
jgi:hypothetical protein